MRYLNSAVACAPAVPEDGPGRSAVSSLLRLSRICSNRAWRHRRARSPCLYSVDHREHRHGQNVLCEIGRHAGSYRPRRNSISAIRRWVHAALSVVNASHERGIRIWIYHLHIGGVPKWMWPMPAGSVQPRVVTPINARNSLRMDRFSLAIPRRQMHCVGSFDFFFRPQIGRVRALSTTEYARSYCASRFSFISSLHRVLDKKFFASTTSRVLPIWRDQDVSEIARRQNGRA